MVLVSQDLLADDDELANWYQTAVAYWSAQHTDAVILGNETRAQIAQTMLDALAVGGMSDITVEDHGED